MKKILLAIVLLVTFGFLIFRLFISSTPMDWGHHFTFENELGIEIDSLKITVGDSATIIRHDEVPGSELEGNLRVPEGGYPDSVSISVYSGAKTIQLNADSFDCYNCDGYHQYTLKPSGATYLFYN